MFHRPLCTAIVFALAPFATTAQPLPTFFNFTNITNPYFPISTLGRGIMIGTDEGLSSRSEETLLPTTRFITWAGGVTETRIAYYVSYHDGQLVETAYDYYAQGDDGHVYYFGEDVFNYEDGEIINTNGTWLAGRDGAPPGIIMLASPQVGDVFTPENFPPLVFEQDTVLSLTYPVNTPAGPITTGLRIRELLLEGTEEFKIYAPGFGVVDAAAPDEHSALVLRTTASTHRDVPLFLENIESRADDLLDSVPNWARVQRLAARISSAWNRHRPPAIADQAPQDFITALDHRLADLNIAIAARDARLTRLAANHLRAAALDLAEPYNPAIPLDLERINIQQRELVLNIRSSDWTAARASHAASADALWARLRDAARLHGATQSADAIDNLFDQQAAAIDDQDTAATVRTVRRIMKAIENLEPAFGDPDDSASE